MLGLMVNAETTVLLDIPIDLKHCITYHQKKQQHYHIFNEYIEKWVAGPQKLQLLHVNTKGDLLLIDVAVTTKTSLVLLLLFDLYLAFVELILIVVLGKVAHLC